MLVWYIGLMWYCFVLYFALRFKHVLYIWFGNAGLEYLFDICCLIYVLCFVDIVCFRARIVW